METGQETIDKVEETIEPSQPASEPQAPTIEELQKQLDEYRQKHELSDKEARGAQAKVTELNRKLKEISNTDSRIEAINERIELLAAAFASGQSPDSFADPESRKPILDELKRMKAQEEAKKKEEQVRQAQDEYVNKATEMLNQAIESGIAKDSEEYEDMFDYLKKGDDVSARRVMRNFKKNKVEGDKVENKEVEALKKEVERLKKIASGELDTETGHPSGATTNEAQVRKNFRERPNDPKARNEYYNLIKK